MKNLFQAISMIICFALTNVLSAQSVYMPRNPSPAAFIQQRVGASIVSIDYSRPSVVALSGADRTGHIWGEMVPWDFELQSSYGNKKPLPWRAGANENTVFRISHDAKVEGEDLAAGAYGLFVAMHRDGSATVIFSKDTASWGSFFYEEANDALRVKVNSEEIPLTKRLVYDFHDITKSSCLVALDWEKKRIPFHLTFETDEIVFKGLAEKINSLTKPTWRDYNNPARYCYQNNVHLEEALQWVEKSLELEKNFSNQTLYAGILSKSGKKAEADKLIKGLLKGDEITDENYYSYGQQLIGEKRYDEALDLFKKLGKRWPESWLQYHGAGRTYSAMKDFSRALENEKEALKRAPEANKYFVTRAIQMLEAGIDFNTI